MKNLIFILTFLLSYTIMTAQSIEIPENIECDFAWSTIPQLDPSNNKVAKGTINGINYTYTSSEPVTFGGGVFGYGEFRAQDKIPNQRCILNSKVSSNVLEFASPIKDPVLVFASIGRPGVEVPVVFKHDIKVLFQKGLSHTDARSIKGKEGYAIVQIKGEHTRIEFDYTVEEYYANFLFGASLSCEDEEELPLECDFFWSTTPQLDAGNNKVAKGVIKGVNYTYTSSQPIAFTGNIFGYGEFRSQDKIPNQRCIQNSKVSSNVLEFDSPLKDPVLVFASIGRSGLEVPIVFKHDIKVLFQKGLSHTDTRSIKGKEGYTIVQIKGEHTRIEFDYTVEEFYANFLFGASLCGESRGEGSTPTTSTPPTTSVVKTSNTWTNLGGSGADVAIDGKDYKWTVGGGNAIYYHDGTGWKAYNNGYKGKRIAADANGNPHIISMNNGYSRGVGTTNQIAHHGGGCKDIAVDPKGNVYVVGTDNVTYSFFGGWNGYIGGKTAKAIAVNPIDGTPYILGTDDVIYKGETTSWTVVGNLPNAIDIAVDPKGRIWAINGTNDLQFLDGGTWKTFSPAVKAKYLDINKNSKLVISSMNTNIQFIDISDL